MERGRTDLLGVGIDNLSRSDARQRAEQMLRSNRFHHVVTPGPEFLLEATANVRFRRILNKADLSLPDGIGLRVAAWLTKRPLHHRITGVDFIHDILRLAQKSRSSVFLYGGGPGVAERAARKILYQYPGLTIAGFESGHRGPWQRLHDRQVVARIHRVRPAILLVALGAPKQELWIDTHHRALHHVRLAVGVGRTFDYLAGDIQRPPVVIQRLGLEWLHTFLFANRFYQPEYRRQRVRNATWHFVREVWRTRHA